MRIWNTKFNRSPPHLPPNMGKKISSTQHLYSCHNNGIHVGQQFALSTGQQQVELVGHVDKGPWLYLCPVVCIGGREVLQRRKQHVDYTFWGKWRTWRRRFPSYSQKWVIQFQSSHLWLFFWWCVKCFYFHICPSGRRSRSRVRVRCAGCHAAALLKHLYWLQRFVDANIPQLWFLLQRLTPQDGYRKTKQKTEVHVEDLKRLLWF